MSYSTPWSTGFKITAEMIEDDPLIVQGAFAQLFKPGLRAAIRGLSYDYIVVDDISDCDTYAIPFFNSTDPEGFEEYVARLEHDLWLEQVHAEWLENFS